ncbi:hypothetical protein FT663_03823 [Candidozyma haemuli var. vulneris]|uniref:Cyclin N-terminal domain-containing protein n=1 Tax=Candidozyma haemuli TaxID=45357 RepID=A0A2V1AYN0_9ASCO|nr:hypothetical protein CXQ85_002700 [[Candida] haemuloni]KAF3988926.1 hypothetical protein FT663_03823 [[Candida] haemuloni var. vulneris]KAF3992093.1 hypothetical protein FT662_01402 [[Candida] haemuloni var. vulneris]PVH22975.1 hypothetical protein CXQ85_002700 [[Candida] haemuloni]
MFSSNIGTSGHRASASYSGYPYSQYKPMPAGSFQHQVPFQHHQHHQHQHQMSMGMGPGYYSNSMVQGPPAYMPVQAPVAPMNAPALPPVAAPAPAPAPAPAASAGGINAVLEYEPNDMAAFLCWCAFGMLNQNRNPTKDFEKMAVSILYATRLPKSSIIIALEYMNQRFSSAPLGYMSEHEVFVKLVVALVLANKFNDDNTFTNRSWCGATGLQIEVINEEEATWLREVQWQLNVVKFRDNIRTLEECWKTWLDKYSPQNQSNNVSSPVSSSDRGYYSSSPIPSSPSYQSSISSGYNISPSDMSPAKYAQEPSWASNYNFRPSYPSQPSIWAYTPTQYQYVPQHDPAMSGANYFGYNNPYYACNMASC